MSAEADHRLRVVLFWHMHQPEYRDPLDRTFLAPWTYLHAIKDYADMAAHLEAAPESARAVVNFPPILLEQIHDYADRLDAWLKHDSALGDPLLAALAAAEMPAASEQRRALLERCLDAHEQHLIQRFPAFARLTAMSRQALATATGPDYLSDRHLADTLTWYHLAWFGETIRRRDTRVRALTSKAEGYTADERRELVAIIGELLTGLVGRYQELAAAGRVELSTSPYTHAMLPLLIDFRAAREARPGTTLPRHSHYPGGAARVAWQLQQARNYCDARLARQPLGCWPSEGGLSEQSLNAIGQHGFTWTATGQAVLRHSLADEATSDALHRPYRLTDNGPACFFRDDELSDLIGFAYKDWHADDAVADFVARLERIASDGGTGRVVPVILDGENPWEHYPHNGYHFVPALYEALDRHPHIHLTTFAECLDEPAVRVAKLPHLVAGSWVYGDFGTWMGDPDKNRAWDLLCEAKAMVDRKLPFISSAARQAVVERQVGVCEGSDWFWWFGDYNPPAVVAEFDQLYRRQLMALYSMLDEPVPDGLSEAVSRGSGQPELGGTMRRSS